MRTTIDKAGRVVVPRELREQVGLVPGPIDITVVGGAIQIEVVAEEGSLDDVDGLLTLRASGTAVTDEDVRELRLGLQR